MGSNSSRSAATPQTGSFLRRRQRVVQATSSLDQSIDESERTIEEEVRDVDVYCGEIRDGEYHGHGRLRYASSDGRQRDVYEGHFSFGKRNGKGRLTWTNGTVYEGQWKNDRLHGSGILLLPTGLRYEGDFYENKFHGEGILEWKSGKCYVGSWKGNLRSGKGTLRYSMDDSRNRLEYQGEWAEGKRHGQGVMRWTNGASYEGEWRKGKREGLGKHTFPSRQVYVGGWKNGLRQGEGTRYFPNGDKYSGEWKEDKKDGLGVYVFAHGRRVPKCFDDGVENDDSPTIEHSPQSLQVYCIEAIARDEKLVTGLERKLPHDLAERIRRYRENEMHVQQEPSRFYALVHNALNRFSLTATAGQDTHRLARASATSRFLVKFAGTHPNESKATLPEPSISSAPAI